MNKLPGKPIIYWQVIKTKFWLLFTALQPLWLFLLILIIGISMGGLAIIANNASSKKWAAIVLLAVASPTVALLMRDIRKLLLVGIIIDLPLGIDIALQNQGWHMGGPTGYMVSLVTLILVAGYVLWIIDKHPKVKFCPVTTIPALIYIFMSIWSFQYSEHWQLSSFGLFLKVQVFLMYFYLTNHITTWDDLRLILIVIAISLLVESLLMILQYFTGFSLNLGGLITSSAYAEGGGGAGVSGRRVSGTLGVAGAAALYLNSMLTIIFGAYLADNLIDKRLALGAFILGAVALITTSSRAGWAAFALGLLVILTRAIRTPTSRQRASILFLGGILIGSLFGGPIVQRFSTVSSDSSRYELATMAYNIQHNYPLGVGDNTYDLYMSDKYAHPAWVGHRLYPPHNKYLMIRTELGPQGFLAWLILVFAILWKMRWVFLKAKVNYDLSMLGAGVLGSIAAHLLHNRSETFNSRPHIQLFWFLIAFGTILSYFVTHRVEDPT